MNKSASFGQVINLLALLANNTDWESLDADALQSLMDNPVEFGAQFTTFLRNGNTVVPSMESVPTPAPGTTITDPIILSVEHARTLAEMIRAGKYVWINDNITVDHFPVSVEVTREFEAKLFKFDESVSPQTTVGTMTKVGAGDGWELAKIEHLLAFGEKFPDEQRQYPIVGLGSISEVFGSRQVPCLDHRNSERILDLAWWVDEGWFAVCRFLAVRKMSKSSASSCLSPTL
jgi:hypothetical protein